MTVKLIARDFPPEHSVPATWAWTIGHTLWREEGVVTLCKVSIRLSKSKCTTEYYIKYTDLSSQDLNRRGNDPIEEAVEPRLPIGSKKRNTRSTMVSEVGVHPLIGGLSTRKIFTFKHYYY